MEGEEESGKAWRERRPTVMRTPPAPAATTTTNPKWLSSQSWSRSPRNPRWQIRKVYRLWRRRITCRRVAGIRRSSREGEGRDR